MKDSESYQTGMAVLEKLFGRKPDRSWVPEEFFDITVEHLFGRIWSREGLAMQERSLLTVVLLAAQQNTNELHTHLKGARHLGIPREKLEEAMFHVSHYCGWPTGIHALAAIDKVYSATQRPKEARE